MFTVNGHKWGLLFVSPDSDLLRRSDGSLTVGMTDLNTHTVYIVNNVYGDFLRKIFRHELCHVYALEYGIYFPPYYEEVFADALATYGEEILNKSNELCIRCGKC